MATPKDVALMMVEELNKTGVLDHEYAVNTILSKFGEKFIRINKVSNPGIDKAVLKIFRDLSGRLVTWDLAERHWLKKKLKTPLDELIRTSKNLKAELREYIKMCDLAIKGEISLEEFIEFMKANDIKDFDRRLARLIEDIIIRKHLIRKGGNHDNTYGRSSLDARRNR
jgi:hypothetical protein